MSNLSEHEKDSIHGEYLSKSFGEIDHIKKIIDNDIDMHGDIRALTEQIKSLLGWNKFDESQNQAMKTANKFIETCDNYRMRHK